MTVGELCGELNNWFVDWTYHGELEIEDGRLVNGIELKDGQYFRLFGSTFSDDVYQYPASGLTDEVFDGAIWAMAVPPSVIALVDEIDEWQDKYATVLDSPYQSESFGGYSYSKASGNSVDVNSGNVTWQAHFASKLNKWRKIR